MTNNYEYMDESSIDTSLKCIICSDPYINPCSTPCDHTFCRSCITKWIGENDRCPSCGKKPITINGLKTTNRVVFDIIDRLLVRCKTCLKSNIQRGNFDDHSNKYCLTTFISCSAADLKCPWKGPKDRFQTHLSQCNYEIMRPILGNLINTINIITEKVQQYENRIHILETENHRLKDEVKSLNESCTQQTRILNHLKITEAKRQDTCHQLNKKMQLTQILSSPTVDYNPRIGEIISRYHSYSTIMLNNLRLNDFDIPFIIRQALIIKQCSALDLSINFIESTGIELLANALRSNTSLKKLSLKGNQIGNKGVEYLVNALSINNTLEVLQLETNNIDDSAARLLANLFRENCTLKDLYLGYNLIGNQGIEIIGNSFDNKNTIEILSLTGNKLDDKSINFIYKIISNGQKLQKIDLHENQFSLEGKTQLLNIIKTKKAFKLNI